MHTYRILKPLIPIMHASSKSLINETKTCSASTTLMYIGRPEVFEFAPSLLHTSNGESPSITNIVMEIYLFVLWVCVTNAASLNKMNLSLSNASFSKNTTSLTRFQLSSSTAQNQIPYTYSDDARSHRSRLVLDCSRCVFMRLLYSQVILLISNVDQCTAPKEHLCPLHPQHSVNHSKNTGADIIRVITTTDLDWAKILKQWTLPLYSSVLMIPRKAFACLYRKPITVAGSRKAKPLRGDQ